MMKKLKALFDLFRKGERVANPQTWENSIVAVGALATFFVSLDDFAKSSGINLGMTDSELEQVARWVVSTAGLYIMGVKVVTSRRIGLPAKKEPPADEPPPEPL